MRIYQQKSTIEKSKITSKAIVKMSRDLLLGFWDPSISLEWMKLQTSHLERRLATRSTLRRRFFGPPTRLRELSSNAVFQIQDGGRRHIGFPINANNTGVNHTSHVGET